jgi:hypothetical protein
MTKKPGDEGRVVEMDAMDENEWEKDARTPIVQLDQLSKLVQASSESGPPASTSARTANTVPSQSGAMKAAGLGKKDPTPARPQGLTATPSKRDATPAKPSGEASAPKRPIRPAAAPPSATKPNEGPPGARPVAGPTTPKPAAAVPPRSTNDASSSGIAKSISGPASARTIRRDDASGIGKPMSAPPSSPARPASPKPNDASSSGMSPVTDAGSAGVGKAEPPAARKLPLPAPRAGRTAPPPTPVRGMPTPRPGSFAFASSTPREGAKADAAAKPAADVGSTPFERDEDLAIHRTPTSEAAVIGPPLITSRESLEQLQPPSADAATVATPPVAEANPFDDQVWRAEGGSDSSADVEIAGAHPIVGTSPVRDSIVGFAKNRRNLAIVAGGVVALIVLIVIMRGGGDKPSSKPASSARVTKSEPAAKPAAVEPPPAETPPQEVAAVAPPTETPPAETPAETPVETPASESEGSAAHHSASGTKKKSGSTIGGKQVVLEYDTQAREGRPVPNAPQHDQAAISKARTSYAAGNTRLFAGDADGAIKNYKQALAYYPAYVASYRGLGLAYAQKGDKAAAVKALRTYVGTVPGAKDAALIRKRIQSLK